MSRCWEHEVEELECGVLRLEEVVPLEDASQHGGWLEHSVDVLEAGQRVHGKIQQPGCWSLWKVGMGLMEG